jgi:hypothetical protein
MGRLERNLMNHFLAVTAVPCDFSSFSVVKEARRALLFVPLAQGASY